MNTERFHGVLPAMATPFSADGALDELRFTALIEEYLSAGVHGISVAGSQGEFFSLEENERVRLIELAVETVNGRVPLHVGTGGVTTAQSIRLTQIAQSAGADIAMPITPYFIQPNADELVAHYTAIASATELPVLIYNNPPRTSVNITSATYERLLAIDNVIGIKDSSGDLTQAAEMIAFGGPDKLFFSGRDTMIVAIITHGGSGTVSPAANVFPRLVLKLYDAAKTGDRETALRISNALAPMRAAWALGSFPVVIKEAMALVGRDAGPARLPIEPLTPDNRKKLHGVLEQIAPLERAA